MKKRTLFLLIASVVLSLLQTLPAVAQEGTPTLEIKLNRDFGYGGFGEIQGTFSIKAQGPDNLQSVRFYFNEILLGEDTEAPFAVQFNTDNYSSGVTTFSAVGVLDDGREIGSNEITTKVLSNDESKDRTLNLIGPILGIAAVAIALGAVLPALLGRKGKAGPIGEYSMAGGTVCPRCKFPFSRNTLSPNLVVGKLERCPHCGKWSIRARASQADLSAAEERLRASRDEAPGIESDPQDSLRRALDDSRYDD